MRKGASTTPTTVPSTTSDACAKHAVALAAARFSVARTNCVGGPSAARTMSFDATTSRFGAETTLNRSVVFARAARSEAVTSTPITIDRAHSAPRVPETVHPELPPTPRSAGRSACSPPGVQSCRHRMPDERRVLRPIGRRELQLVATRRETLKCDVADRLSRPVWRALTGTTRPVSAIIRSPSFNL